MLRLKQVEAVAWEQGSFQVERAGEDGAGQILSWRWVPDAKGSIRIRKHPEKGVPYVLAGDTAGTGSDFFAGHVLDNRTGDQVAVLHHRCGEREFAEQMYCLGLYYNKALVGIETNYSTYPQMCLEDLGYPNLYVRKRFDNYLGKHVDAYGFVTTAKTRPMIVDGLKAVAKDALDTIWDMDTLREMLVFIYDENWKPQAERGEHDDLVISLAIAHAIRSQQRTQVEADGKSHGSTWSAEALADYWKASPEERAIMERMWGKP